MDTEFSREHIDTSWRWSIWRWALRPGCAVSGHAPSDFYIVDNRRVGTICTRCQKWLRFEEWQEDEEEKPMSHFIFREYIKHGWPEYPIEDMRDG